MHDAAFPVTSRTQGFGCGCFFKEGVADPRGSKTAEMHHHTLRIIYGDQRVHLHIPQDVLQPVGNLATIQKSILERAKNGSNSLQ